MSDMFKDFRTEEAPVDTGFAQLDTLIKELEAAEAAVKAADKALTEALARRDDLVERTIPTYMEDNMGLSEFTTRDGVVVKIVKKIRASIGSNKEDAFAWLSAHGHGNMIKRTIQIAFNKEQEQEAAELSEKLSEEYAGVRTDMAVAPATLTAFVREMLERGEEIPHDIFGIFEQRKAEIKRKLK